MPRILYKLPLWKERGEREAKREGEGEEEGEGKGGRGENERIVQMPTQNKSKLYCCSTDIQNVNYYGGTSLNFAKILSKHLSRKMGFPNHNTTGTSECTTI